MPSAEETERPSPHRKAVFDALREAGAPRGVAEVAALLGVHPNTVRFHLDALVSQGRVERAVERPSGPGRPRTVYSVRRGMDRGGTRRYELLARILLSGLTRSGADAASVAADAGRAWGRYLIGRVPPTHRTTAGEATERLTAMLDNLGFDPRPVKDDDPPDQVWLRHCPFLELAEEHSSIVCPLHLGLMQGALTELDAPLAATRLDPFAEPDACLAHLSPTRTA